MRLCFSFPLRLSLCLSLYLCMCAISLSVCLCAHFSSHSIWVSITFAHPFYTPTHMCSAHPATQQSHISGYLSLYPFLPLLSRSLYLDICVLNNFHLLFFGPTFPACTKYSTVFFLLEHLTNLSPLHPFSFSPLYLLHLLLLTLYFFLLRGQQLSVCF